MRFMRRVAASRVFINEKEFHNNYVVELFNHIVTSYLPLTEELPMTEWLGGTIIIRNREAYHTPEILSPAEFCTNNGCSNRYIQRL